MVVSREEVNEMERLRRVLNGDRSAKPSSAIKTMDSGSSPILDGVSTGVTQQDISEMSKILKNFSDATGVQSFKKLHDNATNVVAELKNRSNTSVELREALVTEKTDDGVKIGSWKIIKGTRQSSLGNPESYFRVHNVDTGQRIKAVFLVSESAMSVIKILNGGADIRHPTIQKIARLEMDYRSAKERALQEKQYLLRAKEKNREFKINLYEAKYEVSRTRALLIREQIKNIFLSI